jgi:cytidylate kinase
VRDENTAGATGTARGAGVRFTGVLALDGPSGTGKSTVARRLADHVGARYLDTGAMYRAATLAVLRSGVDPSDPHAVGEVVQGATISISTDARHPGITVDGDDVTAEIRTPAVTSAVSAVSAVPSVRTTLVAMQRRLIDPGGIVVEGRDIGSVVWPSARPKVYLTASARARAARRAAELGPATDIAAVAADIERRDTLDSSRAVSPLTRSPDAVHLDTTHLEIDDVIDRLVDLIRAGDAHD